MADGTPAHVFSVATLRAAYGVDAEIAQGRDGRPWIRVASAEEERA